MSYTMPAKLAYQGVLIERPCAHCDTVNYHQDNLCQEGPCAQCGVNRRHAGSRHHDWTADHEWVANTYDPADFTTRSTAFLEMLAVVRQTGYPERYTSDLFRDYQALTGQGIWASKRMEDERFIWCLRPSGTHIFRHDDYGRGGLSYYRDNEKDARYYLWAGPRGLMYLQNGDTAASILAMPPVIYARCHGGTWHDASCSHQPVRADR